MRRERRLFFAADVGTFFSAKVTISRKFCLIAHCCNTCCEILPEAGKQIRHGSEWEESIGLEFKSPTSGKSGQKWGTHSEDHCVYRGRRKLVSAMTPRADASTVSREE